MANYFSYFPKTFYKPIDEGSDFDIVTNVMARFKLQENLKTNTALYYTYKIQEEDTPEVLAYKVYGDPEKHWMILMFNDMIDPQYDWPLTDRALNLFVNSKYSSNANTQSGQTGLMWARQNIHSYYKDITTTFEQNSNIISLQIDSGTYANTSLSSTTITLDGGYQVQKTVSKKTKSYYEYEYELNESKRNIKLIKKEFANSLMKELKNTFLT